MTITPNDQLVSKVRAAVTAKVAFDEHISLKTAKAIIYWDRHVAGSEDPHVVGVQQNPDGTTTVFFGIITPP
jgi:hypothetical protein